MIELDNIHIQYSHTLLENGSLKICPFQVTLIKGDSGSGKTSLLHRIGLIVCDCTIHWYNGLIMDNLKEKDIDQIRRKHIGFVLQDNEIISYLSVQESLELYGSVAGISCSQSDMIKVLADVELDVPLTQIVSTLSLGEKQRLAIACALIKRPKVIILDEPTASLDKYNKKIIFQLLKKIAGQGHYVIVASHDKMAETIADKIYLIKDKKLILSDDTYTLQKENDSYYDNTFNYKDINFLKKYISLNKKRMNKKYILSVFLIILLVLIMTMTNILLAKYNTDTIERLYSQSDNVLFIYNSSQNYIDDIVDSIYMDDTNAHPYIKMTLNNYPEVYIIPYFDNMSFDNKVDISISNSKTGVYFSHALYKNIENFSINKEINLSFDIWSTQNVAKKSNRIFEFNGILKKGVKQQYSKQSDLYIYMYYQDMIDLYNENFTDSSYYGYVMNFNNFNMLKNKKELLEKNGYNTNVIGLNYDNLENIVDSNYNFVFKVNLILFLISFIIFVIKDIYVFQTKKKEFAILRLNGISANKFSMILFLEFVYQIVYSLSFVFALGCVIVFINISYLVYIFNSLLLILVIQVLIYFKNVIFLYQIDIEKILRITS